MVDGGQSHKTEPASLFCLSGGRRGTYLPCWPLMDPPHPPTDVEAFTAAALWSLLLDPQNGEL